MTYTQIRRAENQAISRTLTAQGISAREIAAVLGVNPRTITRWRAAQRRTTSEV